MKRQRRAGTRGKGSCESPATPPGVSYTPTCGAKTARRQQASSMRAAWTTRSCTPLPQTLPPAARASLVVSDHAVLAAALSLLEAAAASDHEGPEHG